jgi:hypothetical protein
MCGSNGQVSVLPETAFVRRFIAQRVLYNICKKKGLSAVKRKLRADPQFARTGLEVERLTEEVARDYRQLDASIYRHMVKNYVNDDTTYVCDKDPRLIEYLPLIKCIFQNATIIHIIRDPRDVLVSKKKAAWSRQGHVYKHVFAGRVQFFLGRKQGPQKFGNDYHEILYEHLISKPQHTLQRLCNEINIPFDAEMLTFGKAAENLVSHQEMSWKKETLGPLLSHNTGKWERELKPREIRLVELCSKEVMQAGGYHFSEKTNKMKLSDHLWIWFGVLLITSATIPYVWFRNWKVNQVCRRLK